MREAMDNELFSLMWKCRSLLDDPTLKLHNVQTECIKQLNVSYIKGTSIPDDKMHAIKSVMLNELISRFCEAYPSLGDQINLDYFQDIDDTDGDT